MTQPASMAMRMGMAMACRRWKMTKWFDTEVSNGVFDFGVSKQNLNSSEIAGSLVDQGGLGTAERMRSVFLGVQANRRNPFIDQSRVLSSAEVPFVVDRLENA